MYKNYNMNQVTLSLDLEIYLEKMILFLSSMS